MPVIRGTELYELWRTGRYRNYTPNVLVDIVGRILALVPPWTRVYRIRQYAPYLPLNHIAHDYTLRDIPPPLVSSGCEKFW